MRDAARVADPVAFVRADWHLHRRIAELSPNSMLCSFYLSLLDQIEGHTLSVLPVQEQPLPEYIAQRHLLHRDLVDAIADHNRDRALELIKQHNISDPRKPQSSATVAMTTAGDQSGGPVCLLIVQFKTPSKG